MNLHARDCSPIEPQPSRVETEWLRDLQRAVRPSAHVVSVGGDRDDDDPVVYCERDGTWWAGRYVGTLRFAGSKLAIAPRLGIHTLRSWLFQVTNIAIVDAPGELRDDDAFIVQLLALVWARSFVDAARHGLPALRREVHSTGSVIRGRLDIAKSVRLLAAGSESVASVRSERSLDHAASRAIVAAYSVLRRWMGPGTEDHWLPARAQDLLPHLLAVTGARPQPPSKLDLQRVRYTPITAPFRAVAELSRQIANQRGLATDATDDGTCQGVLLDVAELWELYVLGVLRRAAPRCDVDHGTRDIVGGEYLLKSTVDGQTLARLRPDAIVRCRREVVGIVDAKYKRLTPTAAAPNGPQREDLYQLAAYLTRYSKGRGATWGALVYPEDAQVRPPAETRSPWRLDANREVHLLTLPHDLDAAVAKLRASLPQPVGVTRSSVLSGAAHGRRATATPCP